MIKVNENKILEMINNNDLVGLKKYIDWEVYSQLKVDKTEKQRIKAFQSFVKQCKKQNNIMRPAIAGGFIRNDKLYATDGFTLIQMNDTSIQCEMIGEGLKTINAENILIRNDKSIQIDLASHVEKITLQCKEYKANIKGKRKEKKPNEVNKGIYIINTESFEIGFDVEKLKVITDIIDVNKSECYVYNSVSPLFIENENAKGLLCPVRLNRD